MKLNWQGVQIVYSTSCSIPNGKPGQWTYMYLQVVCYVIHILYKVQCIAIGPSCMCAMGGMQVLAAFLSQLLYLTYLNDKTHMCME